MSNHSDERVVTTQQRWAARGMWIFSIALSIDLMVRLLILKQDPRQCLDISLIWMATTVYVAYGMIANGVAPYGGKWSTGLLAVLIIAVEVPVVLALMGMIHTLADLIADIVSAAASAFVMLVILRGIYGRWERVTLGREPRED
jgi:hypothetical protein